MSKHWDYDVPSVELWREVLRVLKPGGHLLSFGGTRTYHRMVVAIEDAGFEIRDQLQWLYGSGFPKSMDVSKAIDKAAGAERVAIGPGTRHSSKSFGAKRGDVTYGTFAGGVPPMTAPATDDAKQWSGWGTALKPANEPIVLARKPLAEKTVAKNVVKYGTGALNIDACRIATEDNLNGGAYSPGDRQRNEYAFGGGIGRGVMRGANGDFKQPQGRWPANVLFNEAAAAMIDEQAEGVSRFFYVAKASKSERNAGLEGMPIVMQRLDDRPAQQVANHHPTVKPIKLMEYLIKLITPPTGTVLDPFGGSGSTMVAAERLGFSGVMIEREYEYVEIAKVRVAAAVEPPNIDDDQLELPV